MTDDLEAVEPPTRVLIVDDHGVVRRGLRSYLAIYPDIEIVGEAVGGAEAVAALTTAEASGQLADVVLMDLVMSGMDGVEATRIIRARWPRIEVVALTSFVEETRVTAALDAGASGYIIKDAAPVEIVLAIRAARRGEIMLDPSVTRRLMAARGAVAGRLPTDELTPREYEVLALVASGLNNHDIARRLNTSERTARTHVSHILRKLNLTSRTQAALFAVEHGLATPRSS